MENCIFCKIIKKEAPSHTVYEDTSYIVFLTIGPVNPGHLLVVPKGHSSYIFDIEEPTYSELFTLSKKIAKALKQVTKAKRIGLAIEGFGVDHTHIHLIPINKPYDLDPNRARHASQKELAEMTIKIKEALNNQKEQK